MSLIQSFGFEKQYLIPISWPLIPQTPLKCDRLLTQRQTASKFIEIDQRLGWGGHRFLKFDPLPERDNHCNRSAFFIQYELVLNCKHRSFSFLQEWRWLRKSISCVCLLYLAAFCFVEHFFYRFLHVYSLFRLIQHVGERCRCFPNVQLARDHIGDQAGAVFAE